MLWFRKKTLPITVSPPQQSRVEVELHKGANAQATEKANAVNQHLKDLLIENGITLKLYIAAGGDLRKKAGNK
jgi:hypothetical protein